MSYEKDENEIGALWEKQGRNGTYFTGKIGEQPVVVFRNGNKKDGSKAPDWRVMKPVKQDRDQDQRVPPPSHMTDNDIAF
jgi:uncharacterized protein (DUF736 family)